MEPPTTAPPVDRAGLSLGTDATTETVVDLASLQDQLDGRFPFVRVRWSDETGAPLDLLPEGAELVRCVTTDDRVNVLARVPDASIQVIAAASGTKVRVAAPTHRRAEELADAIHARLPRPDPTGVEIDIWHWHPRGGACAVKRSIEAPRWEEVASNYPAAPRRAIDALVDLEEPTGPGKLVLWHGPPGTGKTTALRALARAWSPWCEAEYISDPERLFAEPAYLTEVLSGVAGTMGAPSLRRAGRTDRKWRLLIAEDSDEFLRASARRDAGAALGRLLNLADGILGQGTKVLVLLTTNEETSRLHPALTRPGRCLAAVEFPPFAPHEATQWLEAPVDRPMTLAELLERRGDLRRVGAPPAEREAVGQYL